MKWSRTLISIVAAALLLSGCKIQSVQQYENEKKEKESNVVVVEDTHRDKGENKEQSKAEKESAKKEKPASSISNEGKHEVSVVKEPTPSVNATRKLPIIVTEEAIGSKKSTDNSEKKSTQAPKQKEPKKEKPTNQQTNKPSSTKGKKGEEKPSKKPATKPNAGQNVRPPNKGEGTKPKPVKPPVKKPVEQLHATVQVGVKALLNKDNYEKLPASLQSEQYVPSNGKITPAVSVSFKKGDVAFDVILAAIEKFNVPIDYSISPLMGAYISSINHIAHKEAGVMSGWLYRVNGATPNVGMSNYTLKDGDSIELQYSTNGGKDLGW